MSMSAEAKAKKMAYDRAYNLANKERIAEGRTAYNLANKEKTAETAKAYRLANKEDRAEKAKVYYQANKERIAERGKAYNLANKDACNTKTAKRRAAKLERTVSWSNATAIKAIYTEAHRLTEETGEQHHVDHIIPLQGELVSGLHVENNLQVLTAYDNFSKSNKFKIEENV